MDLKKGLLLTTLLTLIACAPTRQAKMEPVVQLGHSLSAVAVAVSTDSRFVLSGSDDQTVKLWELSTGREIRTFKGIDAQVTAVAFSPDGQTALAGYMDGTLAFWEIATGRKI